MGAEGQSGSMMCGGHFVHTAKDLRRTVRRRYLQGADIRDSIVDMWLLELFL